MDVMQAVLRILPVLAEFILSAERVYAGTQSTGELKKTYVLDAVGQGLSVAAAFGAPGVAEPGVKAQVLALAGGLTDALVAGFNASGAFTKDAAR